MLTQEQIKQLFTYRDGALYNRPGRSGVKAGSRAGWVQKETGYRMVMINRKAYREHILVWIYHHGKRPSGMIDHVSHVRDDNRIEKLRDVSNGVNQLNQKKNRGTKSGVMGVSLLRNSNGFVSFRPEVSVNGKSVKLGCYSDIVEAAAVRLAAEQCLGIDRINQNTEASQLIRDYVGRR